MYLGKESEAAVVTSFVWESWICAGGIERIALQIRRMLANSRGGFALGRLCPNPWAEVREFRQSDLNAFANLIGF